LREKGKNRIRGGKVFLPTIPASEGGNGGKVPRGRPLLIKENSTPKKMGGGLAGHFKKSWAASAGRTISSSYLGKNVSKAPGENQAVKDSEVEASSGWRSSKDGRPKEAFARKKRGGDNYSLFKDKKKGWRRGEKYPEIPTRKRGGIAERDPQFDE